MPNRMLREGIVDSRRVAAVSDSAKALFYKLISVADDFGRFEADPELLRRRLFIWEMEHVSASDIENRLNECEKANLIRLYAALGKHYLEILNFRQQLRARSKYPDANGSYTLPPKDGNRSESVDSGNLQAIDVECNQLQTNALVPTRLDSNRIDLKQKDLPIKGASSSISASGLVGIEGWDELVQQASKARMSLDPDPSSSLCQNVWRWMNLVDKKAAVDGIRDRIDCGEYDLERPHFTPTLENYLHQKKWRSSLRPRTRDSPKNPMHAGALMRLVERG